MTRRTQIPVHARIQPLLPPEGAPNVLVILLDDVGFGASSAFGGPINTPTVERLAGRRHPIHPLSYDGLVRPDPTSAAYRAKPPFRGDGGDHGARHISPWQQLHAPQHEGAGGYQSQVERLLDCAVRQVPRGAGMAVIAHGPIRRLAIRGWRFRVLLWVHRRREQPVRPGPLRGDYTDRAAQDRRGGVSPH